MPCSLSCNLRISRVVLCVLRPTASTFIQPCGDYLDVLGPLALFNGMSSPLLFALPRQAALFGAFATSKRFLHDDSGA